MKIRTEKMINQFNHNNDLNIKVDQADRHITQRKGLSERGKKFIETFYLDAVSRGDIDRVKHFVARGVNIDTTDELGRNSLILASIRGHCHIINYLVKLGVNKAHKDAQGQSALMHASLNKQKSARDLIIKVLVGSDILT